MQKETVAGIYNSLWHIHRICQSEITIFRYQSSNVVNTVQVIFLNVWYLANFSSAISDSEEDGELSVLGELRHLEKHLGKRLKELEVSLSEGFGGVALGTLPLPALFRCLNMIEARCSNCDNSWYIDVSWFGSAHSRGRNCLWRAKEVETLYMHQCESYCVSLNKFKFSWMSIREILDGFVMIMTYPVL